MCMHLVKSEWWERWNSPLPPSCPPLAGGPKSVISRRGLYSLAPCDSAEQNNPVNCFARGGVGRGGKYTSVRDYDVTLYWLLYALLGLFSRNELLGVRGQSPSWLEPFDYSCFSFTVLLFLFASKSKRKSEQGKLWDSSAIRTRIKRLRLRLYPWARATSVWQNGLEIYSNPLILKSDGIGK